MWSPSAAAETFEKHHQEARWTRVGLIHTLWCAVTYRAVSQLSQRSESHVRPQDTSSAAAEVKLTDLVCPLYTLRWAAMQNVLSDLVGVRTAHCRLHNAFWCEVNPLLQGGSASSTQQDHPTAQLPQQCSCAVLEAVKACACLWLRLCLLLGLRHCAL